MNETTITLTEEELNMVCFALTLLKKHDEKKIKDTTEELAEETDDFWIDLLKTRESGCWERISKCMNLQKKIESRKARATA